MEAEDAFGVSAEGDGGVVAEPAAVFGALEPLACCDPSPDCEW